MEFGREDQLDCIAPVNPDANYAPFGGLPPCLGHRYTVHWFGVPWKVVEHGYVMTTEGGTQYIPLSADQLAELQHDGVIASPAPAYEIPIGWRIAGFSAWALLAGMLIAVVWRQKQHRRLREVRASAELTTTGPVLTYGGDRAIAAAFRPHLLVGERITHQAFAYDREIRSVFDSLKGYKHLVVLTDRRLLMLTSKVGVFGVFTGETGFSAIPRADILQVVGADQRCTILNGHLNITLFVPYVIARYASANQRAFLADLPRLFGQHDLPRAVVVPSASPSNRTA